jgi:hypothetical protein
LFVYDKNVVIARKDKVLTKQSICVVERERLSRCFATLSAFGSAQWRTGLKEKIATVFWASQIDEM